jgi:hypothetical protein
MGSSYQEASTPELRDLFGPKRLPVRVVPMPDELFSSWFVRCAQDNGLRIHQLEHSLIERGRPLFAGDPDRGVWQAHGLELARLMDFPDAIARRTYLRSYVSYLWESVPDHGVWQNILPISNRTRSQRMAGLQYCSQCLRCDDKPYFRKHWRLAFCMTCDLHGCRLRDRCPHCGAAIALHMLKAQNTRLNDPLPLTACHRCGGSLIMEFDDSKVDVELIEFQKTLLMTVERGWISIAGRCVNSALFFQGLRMLMSYFEDRKRSAEAVAYLVPGMASTIERTTRYGGYEACGLDRRLEVVDLTRRLLMLGTEQLAKLLKQRGTTLKDLHRFHLGRTGEVPFWLWEPLHFHVDGTLYSPSDEEISNAVRYLLKHSSRVRLKDVCQLLNLGNRSNPRVAKSTRMHLDSKRLI